MIELTCVSRYFGRFKALDDISLTVPKGQVLGLLGPNGAGKTTTMRLMAGFLAPSGGSVRICGYDTVTQAREVKKRIGYMPEGMPGFFNMNVYDYLEFIAQAKGLTGNALRNELETVFEQADLTDILYRPADTLSKGQKRRVALAAAITGNPDVILLDEPTEGLDPNQKQRVRRLIHRIKENKAIIVSTHILEEIEALCSRAVIIDKGKIVLDDVPREFAALSDKHKNIAVLIPEFHEKKARLVFEEMTQVSIAQETKEKDGAVLFSLTPNAGESTLPDVVDALNRQNIKISDLYVEKGKLEDVFFAFTADKED